MARSAPWKVQQFTQRLSAKEKPLKGRAAKDHIERVNAVRRFLSHEKRWEDR